MPHLSDTVIAFLRREGIRDCTVSAALSGGADSVCLLRCLLDAAPVLGLTIRAVHVEHGLRGEESLRDAAFCRELCMQWQVPLHVESADVRGYAREHRCSEETAARECRYAVFDAIPGLIATAHTASDNLETMLFRMARGTGMHGMCGIPVRRGKYLRPLLTCTRAEIEGFLNAQGIGYVTDSTNLTDDHARNLLRHHAVPALQRINPAAERKAAELCSILREEDAYLTALADAAYAECMQPDGSLRGLSRQPVALQRRCIARFLETAGLPCGYHEILAVQALLTKGGALDADRSGTVVACTQDTLFLRETQPEVSARLVIGENVLFSGHIVFAELISCEEFRKSARFHRKFTFSALDYDIIRGYAELHSRRPGLRMRPAGRTHSIRIKKWLSEQVTPMMRPFIHYLSDEQGLLWVEGLGAAAHAAVTDQTKQVLVLRVSHQTDTKRIQD